jgi:hypothetical protein
MLLNKNAIEGRALSKTAAFWCFHIPMRWAWLSTKYLCASGEGQSAPPATTTVLHHLLRLNARPHPCTRGYGLTVSINLGRSARHTLTLAIANLLTHGATSCGEPAYQMTLYLFKQVHSTLSLLGRMQHPCSGVPRWSFVNCSHIMLDG